MCEDGQLAHLCYDLILFLSTFLFVSFSPFYFVLLYIINDDLVSVGVHSEMLILILNNMNSYVT